MEIFLGQFPPNYYYVLDYSPSHHFMVSYGKLITLETHNESLINKAGPFLIHSAL